MYKYVCMVFVSTDHAHVLLCINVLPCFRVVHVSGLPYGACNGDKCIDNPAPAIAVGLVLREPSALLPDNGHDLL